jgi:hypothetical protein
VFLTEAGGRLAPDSPPSTWVTVTNGWLTAREELIGLLAQKRREVSERASEPVQNALLALLASGDLERRIRRMRLEYARHQAARPGSPRFATPPRALLLRGQLGLFN